MSTFSSVPRRAVLIVLDGLRPEFVTPGLMPNLDALAARGVRFTDSHAVLPTVTRCNSATLATGCLPGRHGIPGNRFVSRGLRGASLNAGDHRDLHRLRTVREGRIALAPTLADAVHQAGQRTVVLGTGTPGAAQLQNPEAEANADVLVHPAIAIGVEMANVEAAFGPVPGLSIPATDLNRYFTTLATDFVVPQLRPELLIFWHTDPDRSQHAGGPGTQESLGALHDADVNVGAILDSVDSDTAVAVVSDHGFATNIGTVDVEARLQESGALESAGNTARVENGLVYLDHPDKTLEAQVAGALMEMPEVGGVFTRNAVSGTFPLALAGAEGLEGPDILYGLEWDDAVNTSGVQGRAWSHPMRGEGNHGSLSPYEVRNTVIMAGRGLKTGLISDTPMGNTDIAPTLAALLGRSISADPDGRVLVEAFDGGAAPPVGRDVVTASVAGRRQTMPVSTVEGVFYIDEVQVERL